MGRAARAVINLPAILNNYRLAKSLAAGAKAVAVVKADAYGHGATRVARFLEADADAFGVACIEEAMELRAAGIKKPILLLEGFFTADELPVIAEQNFWTSLHRAEQVEMIRNTDLSTPINVWLKMDSGMHRLGIEPEHFADTYQQLSSLSQVNEVVLMSHLACADELDSSHTRHQIDTFNSAVIGIDAPHSIANSPATLAWPELHRDWIRPGLMMYGASPFSESVEAASQLQCAMTLETEVIAIHTIQPGESVGYGATFTCERTTKVGTVAIGYGDGYSRHAGSGTPVFVNGQRTHIIGRVSMDMCTVDLTDLQDVSVGSRVELWGSELSVNEVAEHSGTIPYTLFTGVTKRVPRVYIES
ncbi:alanine racemase [Neptunomonas phycophila]|uniref:alanine racemase n=1 Tax=Neptunomonas phycophila TaxID=1572645 RepID=UPI001BEBC665|nr:alanine racemase [Neptunomonas phycophila]MBT3147154.1 alanine racemase [Neptunomonas phycophila]